MVSSRRRHSHKFHSQTWHCWQLDRSPSQSWLSFHFSLSLCLFFRVKSIDKKIKFCATLQLKLLGSIASRKLLNSVVIESSFLGLNRCGKSCRLRWLNYLRPDIKHGGFTPEEDNVIFTLYSTIGSRQVLHPFFIFVVFFKKNMN